MRLKFLTNDYLLTWNLLYGSSFSEVVHTFKQKLYKTYSRQYINLERDKKEMLLDIKNFIPDDDTLYNLVFETNLYSQLKHDTDKHRMELLKMWDQYNKSINKELKEILKFPLKEEYTIFTLHPIMDTVLTAKNATSIGWGNRKDLKNPPLTMTNIIYYIVKNELGNFGKEYKEIVDVVMELAISNELYTRISGTSSYLKGDETLTFLKRQIYPYWLMYLGCEKEDFPRYMMRDGISFEIDRYVVDESLKRMNLREFIEFCIANQKRIIRINHLEII
ncbi:MAG: hypothetical protein MRZ42_00565 [Tenericutes bacterium]|nr:hypothetical protein [Mycoplasmatota bacterium]